MPFTLIKGTFHVKGYSPDGDSLKLKADNSAHWNKLRGNKVDPNQRGHVQLRVEGIDSLETHYARSPTTHQPLTYAHQATDELLNFLNITNVIWGPTHTRVTSANDGTRGYILARNTGPYGRPICFVFPDTINHPDGSDVFLDTDLVKKSLNYHMLKIGQAYPLFYETLFFDLRNELAGVVGQARASNLGLWPVDATNSGFDAADLAALENSIGIFPKLFRRIIDHNRAGQPLSDLPSRLAQERITIVPTVHHTNYDTVVKIEGDTIRMTEKPEDVIFGTVIR